MRLRGRSRGRQTSCGVNNLLFRRAVCEQHKYGSVRGARSDAGPYSIGPFELRRGETVHALSCKQDDRHAASAELPEIAATFVARLDVEVLIGNALCREVGLCSCAHTAPGRAVHHHCVRLGCAEHSAQRFKAGAVIRVHAHLYRPRIGCSGRVITEVHATACIHPAIQRLGSSWHEDQPRDQQQAPWVRSGLLHCLLTNEVQKSV